MQPNPVLRRLGFSDTDRVAIIHTDDIGMCHASVEAFDRLWDFGLISSGAVMVPCPWFLHAAEYARQHPEADLGVHITLTSEWKTYRWGPISTRDPRSGMVDEQGCFYPLASLARTHGDPASVQTEMEAQVDRAIAMGMQPTHMDTHMGTVAHPKFLLGYLKLAVERRLPPMLFRLDEAGWMAAGLDAETAAMAAQTTQALESAGMPMLDHLVSLHLEFADQRMEYAQKTLGGLKPGISHFIIHPSVNTPELRAITPDWRSRAGDFELFQSAVLRDFIQAQGIHIIGYRRLQELMPDPSILSALPFEPH
jgi:predicted glycoside hydrolase/deacetylase ChbG (UPF0249 family)